MNRVSMVGNITKDADMRYTPNNKAIVSFSIAINEGFGANKTTQYFNIVSFGAEKLCQYLTKGKTVAITGKLKNSSWDKDGVKHYKTDIVADNFGGIEFVGGKGNSSNDNQDYSGTPFGGDDITPVSDGDMPF